MTTDPTTSQDRVREALLDELRDAHRNVKAALFAGENGRSYLAGWEHNAIGKAIAALATPSPTGWRDIATDASGWIVGNGAGDKWRTWKDGWSSWTADRDQATRYARRIDAEAVHAEDDDAWRVEPYIAPGTTPEPPAATVPAALSDVAAERHRQVAQLGWTPEHDDEHDCDDALWGAAIYYACAEEGDAGPVIRGWPRGWPWKPKDRRTNLVRAAALLVAEIERLDRAAAPTTADEREEGR